MQVTEKYCRMPQGEHSAILSTFIKLPFFIITFVLSIFEWPLKTGFPVVVKVFCVSSSRYRWLVQRLVILAYVLLFDEIIFNAIKLVKT